MKNTNLNMLARPVDLINFYQMPMLVIEYNNEQYIKLRPVVEMLELVWKRARENVLTDENKALFGVKTLNIVPTDVYLSEQALNSAPYGAENQGSKGDIYILLNRVHLYLARVQTAQMRANGNETGADRLLTLQKEWGDTLYRYETTGVAIKKSQHSTLKDLFAMKRNATSEQKQRIDLLIAQELNDIGCPQLEDTQKSLF